jgi:hypothetical protein
MFSEAEKAIFGELLEQVSQELSNNSCNDVPVNVTEGNKADLVALIEEYAQDEDDKESLLESLEEGKVYFSDWMLIDYLRGQILKA